jgi:hypothetical protein
MTNKFKSKFLKLLKEAPELDFDPSMERDAATASLDGSDNVGIDDYDIDVDPDPNASDEIGDVIARQDEQMGGMLDEWSNNIDKFIQYINGDQAKSIQTTLKNANPDSVLGNLQRHQDRIAKIAAELAGLRQAFIGGKNIK